MSTTSFYPSLSTLVPIDNIPDDFGVIKQGIAAVFDHLYYKDLQISHDIDGASAFYTLSIVTFKRLSIEIPGTDGLALVLNPDLANNNTGNSTSVFPLSLGYKWPILKYSKILDDLSGFDFSPKAFYGLMLDISGTSNASIVLGVINIFIANPDDPSSAPPDPIQKFVDDYNSNANHKPATPLVISNPDDPDIDIVEDLLTQLVTKGNNFDIITNVFDDYISNSEDVLQNLEKLFSGFLDNFTIDDIKALLIPQLSASVKWDFGLEFPPTILVKVNSTGQPQLNSDGSNIPAMITCTGGTIGYSTVSGLTFSDDFTINTDQYVEIKGTGFYFNIQGLKLDLSRTTNIPEVTADGRPLDFMGVYISEADIFFPESWNHLPGDTANTGELKITNLIAGTGGVSGTFAMQAKSGVMTAPIIKVNIGGTNDGSTVTGGFDIELDTFSITLQQDVITACAIAGKLTIPGFNISGSPAVIAIQVTIGKDGRLSITGTLDTPFTISIQDVLDFHVKSLEVGDVNGKFFVAVSGTVDITLNVPVLGDVLPKSVDIKKLTIWDDGEIELEGGNIVLPKPVSLKIGPVDLSISAISFGSYDNTSNGKKYRYFGFDGGVNINPGGVDARANGVKVYYQINQGSGSRDIFVRIEGIAIDITIPGNASAADASLLLHGFLSVKNGDPNDPNSEEYAGGISFSLPKVEIEGSAAMMLNPKKPAFIVDIDLEIPTPIPLAATGLGIYGFRGLIGQRYVASKTAAGLTEDAEWWQYYKAKVAQDYHEGIQVSKFQQEDGFSLGAGVTLATVPDDGFTFSSKIFFLLSLPEVFLLEGQANILSQRIGLDTTDDPPFYLLIAITDQSLQVAIGINYKMPEDTGEILTLDALIEMGFFWGDSGAWYIDFGRDTPDEKRIQAKIFNLFDAYAYLMLSSAGIKAGAGVSWSFSKKFGPIGLELGAQLDVAGHISFRPQQIGGSIDLSGYARIVVFKFKLGFEVDASLAAEARHPFVITGSLSISIKLPWPIGKKSLHVDFTWTIDATPSYAEIPVVNISDPNTLPAKALNIMSLESFPVLCLDSDFAHDDHRLENYYIPVDSFIDIEFLKSVMPGGTAASNFGGQFTGVVNTEFVPPQQGKHERVQHSFTVDYINIYYDNGGSWTAYDIYGVETPQAALPFISQSVLSTLKSGYWQFMDSPDKLTKLRILSQDVLSWTTQSSPAITIPEQLGVTAQDIFCGEDVITESYCVSFDGLDYSTVPANTPRFIKGRLLIRISQTDGVIKPITNPYGLTNGLQLSPGDLLEIFFSEPVAYTELKVYTKSDSVTVSYYKRAPTGSYDSNNLPIYDYFLIATDTLLRSQISEKIEYSDGSNPVDYIKLQAGVCSVQPNLTCTLSGFVPFLQAFLDALATYGNLTKSFNFDDDPTSIYNTKFTNTILYNPLKPREPGDCCHSNLHYNVVTNTTNNFSATVTDDDGFSAGFQLQLPMPNGGFNFNNISSVSGLVADPDNETGSTNYTFQVTVTINGVQYLLKGATTYPISFCYEEDLLLQESSSYVLQENTSKIILNNNEADICSTVLFEVCWLTVTDYIYNLSIPAKAAVKAQDQAMIAALTQSIQPIWRPNTTYRINFHTTDSLYTSSHSTSYPHDYYIGFKTGGPVGFFQNNDPNYAALLAQNLEDQYKLASLKDYIDYSKSYPNADGNILNAKPLFYKNPTILIFYVNQYVYSMFAGWAALSSLPAITGSMDILIKDPVELPTPILVNPVWAQTNSAPISKGIGILNNMLQNGNPCNPAPPIQPIGIKSVINLDNYLQPLKLYTVIVLNNFNGTESEVYRYPFQTSRYQDFDEQIGSYMLSSTANAVFDIVNNFQVTRSFDGQTMTNVVKSIIAGTMVPTDPLITQFGDVFDRIVNGALQMTAIDPPATTEFNVLRDSSQGNAVIGILVKSPEPFNDPKIPLYVLNGKNAIRLSLGLIFNEFNVVYSKDRSQAFITNNNMIMGTGVATFYFSYLLYDQEAKDYVVQGDIPTAQFTIS